MRLVRQDSPGVLDSGFALHALLLVTFEGSACVSRSCHDLRFCIYGYYWMMVSRVCFHVVIGESQCCRHIWWPPRRSACFLRYMGSLS